MVMVSIIRRGVRFGYCTTNQAPLAELVAEADETLFKNIPVFNCWRPSFRCGWCSTMDQSATWHRRDEWHTVTFCCGLKRDNHVLLFCFSSFLYLVVLAVFT